MFSRRLLFSYKTMLLSSLFLMFSIYSVFVSSPITSYANHAQEISISQDFALFVPLTSGGNQVNVLVNYTANDPSIVNQMVNSVMKVYTTNRTLINKSS